MLQHRRCRVHNMTFASFIGICLSVCSRLVLPVEADLDLLRRAAERLDAWNSEATETRYGSLHSDIAIRSLHFDTAIASLQSAAA